MTGRRIATGLLAAAALGLAVGLLGGEQRRLSIELWLATTAAWLAWIAIGQITSIAPVRPDRFEGLLLRRRRADEPESRPRLLANLEGLLANAGHSERAATIRLRPRLVELTDGLLRSRHGIDASVEPARAAAVLGDVAWIVDTGGELPRSPAPEEIDRLLARVTGEGDGGDVSDDGR